jgi:hypothetical protein
MGEQTSEELIEDLKQKHGFVRQRVQRFAEIANTDSLRIALHCFFETKPSQITAKVLPKFIAHEEIVCLPSHLSIYILTE